VQKPIEIKEEGAESSTKEEEERVKIVSSKPIKVFSSDSN